MRKYLTTRKTRCFLIATNSRCIIADNDRVLEER